MNIPLNWIYAGASTEEEGLPIHFIHIIFDEHRDWSPTDDFFCHCSDTRQLRHVFEGWHLFVADYTVDLTLQKGQFLGMKSHGEEETWDYWYHPPEDDFARLIPYNEEARAAFRGLIQGNLQSTAQLPAYSALYMQWKFAKDNNAAGIDWRPCHASLIQEHNFRKSIVKNNASCSPAMLTRHQARWMLLAEDRKRDPQSMLQ